VRRALRLRHDELAAEQLDPLARLEEPDLDQPVILGARKSTRSRLVARHRRQRNGLLQPGQRV
jgi:hypothetical protein